MPKATRRPTMYSSMVRSVIERHQREGRGAFTVQELAQYAGIKVTHNLRARLSEFVQKGELECVFAYRETSRPVFVYYLSEPNQIWGGIPF